MKDGQVFEIIIEHLGIRGDGTGKLPGGRPVFVAGALPGERVRIETTGEKPEGVTARLAEIIVSAPERAPPPCIYFGACGGCALQHMNAASYAAFKKRRVAAAFARFGLDAVMLGDPIISPPQSRRRAVLSARRDDAGAFVFGFNERASHKLVAIQSCAVLDPALERLLPALRGALPGVVRHGESLDVALTAGAGGSVDMLMTLLGRQGRMCDKAEQAALRGMATAAGISRISWQQRRDHAPRTIFDDSAFAVQFADFRVVPAPGAFLQATAEGEAALTGFAAAAIPARGRVADLYAGCGTFSFVLLARGSAVDAFEGDEAAVGALQAAGRGHAKLRATRRDLAKEPLSFQELRPYDAVLVDPPRLGAQRQMEEIARSPVARVLSVSCNPDTFARDAAILTGGGFRIDRAIIVDQFLWSPHVELAALFTRR